MSFDGITTRAILHEMKAQIIGAKINKVSQTGKNEIILSLYNPHAENDGPWKKTVRLFISVSSNHPCIFFMQQSKENPIDAPNFCMFLRKHIQNGVIKNIRQHTLDRIIFMDIDAYDELGDPQHLTLIIELMGKYSNIILVNQEDQRIMDALKRITVDMSNIRQIQSGMTYETVADEKYNILEKYPRPSEILPTIEKPFQLFQLFYRYYTGFGPLIAREILFKANIELEKKTSEVTVEEIRRLDVVFEKYVSMISENKFSSYGIYRENQLVEFYVFPITYLASEIRLTDTLSALLETVYFNSSKDDIIGQRASELKKIVAQKLNRDHHKMENLKSDLTDARNREQYKLFGDLLSANVHRIQKGMSEITVENFYDGMKEVTIPLSPKLSAWDNVQSQYKKFSKRKKREKIIHKELPRLEEEILYLNSLIDTLDRVEKNAEINDIREEMMEMKLIRKKAKKKSSIQKSKPLHFITKNNIDIYVGKNNHQNDQLTLKVANKEDYFFHAKDIPGSHVIMRNENVTEEDIQLAAFLAAIHSGARNEKYVLVDYTKKKNVRKAKNAKPGMVYYENFVTINVATDAFELQDIHMVK